MEIKSDNPDHGFQFPGEFEITAMGPASAGLEAEIPRAAANIGIVRDLGRHAYEPVWRAMQRFTDARNDDWG